MKYNFQGFLPISPIREKDYHRIIDFEDYNQIYEFTTTKDFLSHILYHTIPEFERAHPRKIAQSLIIGDKNDPLKVDIQDNHYSLDKVLGKRVISFSFGTKIPNSQKLMHVNFTILFDKTYANDLDNHLNYYDWLNYSEYVFQDNYLPVVSNGNYSVQYKYDKHVSLIFCMDCPDTEQNSVMLSKVIIESSSGDWRDNIDWEDFNGNDYSKLYVVGSEKDANYNRIFPFLRTIFNKNIDYDKKKDFLVKKYLVNWNDYYTEGISYLSY